eukprot:2173954-Rhodomonas_salina.2
MNQLFRVYWHDMGQLWPTDYGLPLSYSRILSGTYVWYFQHTRIITPVTKHTPPTPQSNAIPQLLVVSILGRYGGSDGK